MVNKRWVLFCILAALTVSACEKKPPPEDKVLDKLVQDSTYIFSGAVEKSGAAHMESVPVNDKTAVVKISRVYTPSDVLGDLTGKEVTIQLQQDPSTGPGETTVFFTNGWIYGKGIAFMEVGRMKEDQPDKFKSRVDSSLQRKADQQLKDRIDRAAIVAVAKVVKTDELKLDQRLPISEHNPQWREAVLQISSIVKGELQGEELRMIYPESNDEVWIASPKPKVEAEGIWILQKDQQEKGGPKFRVPGYTALDALDFQPKDQLDRVKRLTAKK
ncbi:MAG: hypothetical protein L0Z73_01505 [Gammaproteobacteria bacterium]|nr:hypothetical protein [Gammaproteobacteria bacterium]